MMPVPSSVTLVEAGRAILSSAVPTVREVTVSVRGGRIEAIQPGEPTDGVAALDGEGPRGGGARIGGAGMLLMPALADAHDHGRGLPTIAFGAADAALETWIPALSLQPRIDSYLLTAWALSKLARSGVAAVVHCHNTQSSDDLVHECTRAAAAARDVGVRMAVAVPMSDRNRLGYAPDADVLAHVDPDHRDLVRQRWSGALRSVEAQLRAVDDVAASVGTDADGLVSVQYCPTAPQWCSDELLAGVAEASAATGRRVHMHLFETRYQREWADALYTDGLLKHLDHIGLLSDRLTVAHGVWLTDDELELLAERRVTVSLNSSSNLRLRSGIGRLRRMLDLGVRVGIGMDGMSLDDDDDALRELQVAHLLHAGVGMERGVSPREVLHASTVVGPAAAGSHGSGAIEVGAAADLLLLDRAAYAADVADGAEDDEVTLLFTRARARHVGHLVVAGRHVVGDGRVLGVDEGAIADEVSQRCRSAASEVATSRPAVRALQDGLTRFYLTGGHCCGSTAPIGGTGK